LQERVADPAAGCRVLEVSGVTRQHPTRTRGVAEEALPAHHALKLADGSGVGNRSSDRLAAVGVIHEVRFEVAPEAVKVCPLHEHSDLVEAAVGWASLNHAIAPAVEDKCGFADLSVLEKAPVKGTLTRDHVVPARTGQASDGRASAVRSHHQPRAQLLFSGLAVDADADHTTPVLNQAGDSRRHANFGTGLLCSSRQNRIEHEAPDGHRPTHVAWKRRPGRCPAQVV
jgi:hypothetical protein